MNNSGIACLPVGRSNGSSPRFALAKRGLQVLINNVNIIIRGSSNGRTPGFGPGYWGSNPYPRAPNKKQANSLFFIGSSRSEGDSNKRRASLERERNLPAGRQGSSEKESDDEPELA